MTNLVPDIPPSLRLLGAYFGQGALVHESETVESVLCNFISDQGVTALIEVQGYLTDCLENDTLAKMELKWETSGSAIDFESGTREFFEQVVTFDTVPFANFKPRKTQKPWWKFWV